MRYENLQVDGTIKVRHQGMIAHGKIRRIGPATGGGHGYRMLTLDVDGEAVYLAAHETEIAQAAL